MAQQINTYSIKYTTPWMHGYSYHFGKGVLMQHVIAELRKLQDGVRVLGGRKMDGNQ